jgi:hypothetical protein
MHGQFALEQRLQQRDHGSAFGGVIPSRRIHAAVVHAAPR